jgi:hypothetical protein
MKAKEFTKGAKCWTAKVRIQNPQYVGWVDVMVWAPTAQVARQMFKAQYNIQDWHITAVKELK